MENKTMSPEFVDYTSLSYYIHEEIRNIENETNILAVLMDHYRACDRIGSFRDNMLHKGKEYYVELTEVLDDRINTTRDNKLESLNSHLLK